MEEWFNSRFRQRYRSQNVPKSLDFGYCFAISIIRPRGGLEMHCETAVLALSAQGLSPTDSFDTFNTGILQPLWYRNALFKTNRGLAK